MAEWDNAATLPFPNSRCGASACPRSRFCCTSISPGKPPPPINLLASPRVETKSLPWGCLRIWARATSELEQGFLHSWKYVRLPCSIMGGWCSWLSQLSNTHVCTVGPQFKSGSAHFFGPLLSNSRAPVRQILSPQTNTMTIELMLIATVLTLHPDC